MTNEKKYFSIPFSEDGNKIEIPNISTGGNVAYDSGYGPDYELPVEDSNRKTIGRTGYNAVLNDITSNIQQWQESIFPTWVSDKGDGTPLPYKNGFVVEYKNETWQSTKDNNIEEPSLLTNSWAIFKLSRLGGSSLPTLSEITVSRAGGSGKRSVDGVFGASGPIKPVGAQKRIAYIGPNEPYTTVIDINKNFAFTNLFLICSNDNDAQSLVTGVKLTINDKVIYHRDKEFLFGAGQVLMLVGTAFYASFAGNYDATPESGGAVFGGVTTGGYQLKLELRTGNKKPVDILSDIEFIL